MSDPDFVRAEDEFLLDPRRFNVALTRARMKCLIVVSDAVLRHLPGDRRLAGSAAHLHLFA